MNLNTTEPTSLSFDNLQLNRGLKSKESVKFQSSTASRTASPAQQPEGDQWVAMNVSGRTYGAYLSTLISHPGVIKEMVSPDTPWRRSDLGGGIKLDVDPKHFRHVLDYLRSNRLEKGLPASTLSGISKMADQLAMWDLKAEVKFIYPKREAKRLARGHSDFTFKYIDFANEIYLQGMTMEADEKWNKINYLEDEELENKLNKAFDAETHPRRKGLLEFHLLSLRPFSFDDPSQIDHAHSMSRLVQKYPDSCQIRAALVDCSLLRGSNLVNAAISHIEKLHYMWTVERFAALAAVFYYFDRDVEKGELFMKKFMALDKQERADFTGRSFDFPNNDIQNRWLHILLHLQSKHEEIAAFLPVEEREKVISSLIEDQNKAERKQELENILAIPFAQQMEAILKLSI